METDVNTVGSVSTEKILVCDLINSGIKNCDIITKDLQKIGESCPFGFVPVDPQELARCMINMTKVIRNLHITNLRILDKTGNAEMEIEIQRKES